MATRPPDKQTSWLRYGGVGVEFAAAVGGFALLGYWFDHHYQTRPWGLVIGAALGLIGGTYNLVRESLAAFRSMGPPRKRSLPDDKRPEDGSAA